MTTIIFFLLTAATFTGCFLYRGRGSKIIDWKHPLEQMAFCSIFAFTLAVYDVAWWINTITYLLSVGAVVLGHGQFFLALLVRAISPEKVDFIVRKLFGEDPRTDEKYAKFRNWNQDEHTSEENHDWLEALKEIEAGMNRYGMKKLYARCVTGLAVTGFAVTLAPGVGLMTENVLAGLILALCGLFKGPVYLVSHKTGFETEGGEYGFGGVVWLVGAALIAKVAINVFCVVV